MEVTHNLKSLEQRIDFLAESLKQFSKKHFVITSLIDTQGRTLYLPSLVKDFSEIGGVSSITIVDFEGKHILASLQKPPDYGATINLRSVLELGETVLKISENRKKLLMVEPIEY